ncbi:hypothetical protein [Flavobacterium sp.]
MNYNITNLTQVADCDAMLTWAGNEKADLLLKKSVEERAIVKFTISSAEIDALLQSTIAEIAMYDTMIAGMPDGPLKDEQIKKRRKADYKKFLLENRRESYGAIAILQKQFEVAGMGHEVTELDVLIAAVEAQKAALIAAA